jgi:hypothetical protein
MGMEFLKGSAILGIIVALWDKIKLVAWRITSVAIQRVEFCTQDVHDAVINYLISHYDRLSIYDRMYGAKFEGFRDGRYALVSYEKFGEKSILFKNKKKYFRFLRPFFVFSKKAVSFGAENESSHNESERKVFSALTCIRGTIDFDKLISEATKQRNALTAAHDIEDEEFREKDRFNIFYLPDLNDENHHHYRYSGAGVPWFKQSAYRIITGEAKELGRQYNGKGKALDSLYYPIEVKSLIKTIEQWVKSKDWYLSKNIPWKRGWLLYGKPGTGKTALVRAFAEDLNLPIYVYSLSQMTNKSFTSAWREMQTNIPCIALIEDFDNVFHGRTNVTKFSSIPKADGYSHNQQGSEITNEAVSLLSFDCILNCIDGVDKSNGVFTVITTNDIETIDEAIGKPQTNDDGSKDFISSRPGRIDRAIELTNITKENKLLMATKFFAEYPQSLSKIQAHIHLNKEETPAQFQELCSQLAIEAFWKAKEGQSCVDHSLVGELSKSVTLN